MTGQDQPDNPWRLWLLAGIVIVAIVIALQDRFAAMLRLWLEIDHFNHCLLIAPVSVWLIWRQRRALAAIEPSVSWTGLLMVVFVSGLWTLGEIGGIAVVQDFAAVGLIPLTVWVIFGTPTVRVILFPLGYLLFLVPFGAFLIPQLMTLTADMTVAAVRASGVAIFHDGLHFAIPNGSFRIIEACSGIRMLMAGVAVGALFAYLNFHSWLRRALFLVGVLILVIIANWIRAYTVVMMAHFSGMDLVADHVWLGYVIFAVVIVIMLWVGWHFTDIDYGSETESHPESARSAAPASFVTAMVAACVIVVVVTLAPMFAATMMERAVQTIHQPVASLPAGDDRWSGPGELTGDWSPVFHGDTMTRAGSYSGPEAVVEIYIISYRSLSQQSELINETNRIYTPERWMLVSETVGVSANTAGEPLAYSEAEVYEYGGSHRLVRHWYVVNGRAYRNRVVIKLIELGNILMGRPTSAGVIAVSTTIDDDVRQAALVLDAFMADGIR